MGIGLQDDERNRPLMHGQKILPSPPKMGSSGDPFREMSHELDYPRSVMASETGRSLLLKQETFVTAPVVTM